MKKILVVDDDPDSLNIMTAMVEGCGPVVIKSTDGFRAWEVLGDNPDIALLITDLMMPDMDGFTLVNTMKTKAELSAIPIVVVSAIFPEEEPAVADLLKLKGVYFVAKPVDCEQLQKLIGELS